MSIQIPTSSAMSSSSKGLSRSCMAGIRGERPAVTCKAFPRKLPTKSAIHSSSADPPDSANRASPALRRAPKVRSSPTRTKTVPQKPPYGLKILYSPRKTEPLVDIIFVHGMGGHWLSSWAQLSQQTSRLTESSKFELEKDPWPKAFLKYDIPESRILTFGYDSTTVKTTGSVSNNWVADHARNLLSNIDHLRRKTDSQDRKIIFVAHSLGGLVVEKAICLSETSSQQRLTTINECVHGLALLGTPHRGSKSATYASKIAEMLPKLGRISDKMINYMQPESQVLSELEDSFGEWRKKHPLVHGTCFHEELNVPVFDQVVTKDSAKLSGFQQLSIHANHMDMVKFASRDDDGYRKLVGEIKYWMNDIGSKVPELLPGTGDPALNVHWTVARSANPIFVGRGAILTKIEDSIRDGLKDGNTTKQQRLVITGMGGQGKSEVCLQLANRVRSLFWGVFWVDVSTEQLAISGFLEITSRLQAFANTLDEARQAIANIKERWLLILDNADDHKVDYQRYLPAGSRGLVILTSRNDECRQYATGNAFTLDKLSVNEARELLFRAAGISPDRRARLKGDAESVISLLSSHPLALIQAGSYIGRGHCTLAEYPEVFAQNRKRLLAFQPSQAKSRYGDVYTTFEASADRLRTLAVMDPPSSMTESAQDALDLLLVMANCGLSPLPLWVFEAAWQGAQTVRLGWPDLDDKNKEVVLSPRHVSRLPSFMQAGADIWDSFRLIEAVHLCKVLALVSTESQNGLVSVSMHSLIHAWARDRINERGQHRAWVTTGCMMAMSITRSRSSYPNDQHLLPHLRAVTVWDSNRMFDSEPEVKVTNILLACGQGLQRLEDHDSVFALTNKLLAHLGLSREKVEERWILIYALNAESLVGRREAHKSLRLLEQIMKIQKRNPTADHAFWVWTQLTLAKAYQMTRQTQKAVLLLKRLVEEYTLKQNNASKLEADHNLVQAYRATKLLAIFDLSSAYLINEQAQEAVDLLEQVVKAIKGKWQTPVENAPSKLSLQYLLAIAYRDNGQTGKAVSLLQKVVEIRRQTLAESHPLRLASENDLAIAYYADKQDQRAVSLMEQVVKINRQNLGKQDLDRLLSERNLAIFYYANEQLQRAVNTMKQVVATTNRAFEEQHWFRRESEDRLAHLEYLMSRGEKAFEIPENAER